MTVRLLIKYLANKLGLEDESEVFIYHNTSPINIRSCTSIFLHFILSPLSGLLCYGGLIYLFLLLPRCIVFPFAFSNIGDERNIRARKETSTCTVLM